MWVAKMLAMASIITLLTGCDPIASLHPLFTEEDLVLEPSLVGTWVSGDRDILMFAESRDKTYKATLTGSSGESASFVICVVRLENFLFLDASAPLEESQTRFDLIPAHTFYRIRLQLFHAMEGDVLQVAFLDDDWVEEAIQQEEIKLAHERLDRDILLTASTKDLQSLVVKYAEDEEAFPYATKFHRQK